jgi:hypothetical protein
MLMKVYTYADTRIQDLPRPYPGASVDVCESVYAAYRPSGPTYQNHSHSSQTPSVQHYDDSDEFYTAALRLKSVEPMRRSLLGRCMKGLRHLLS